MPRTQKKSFKHAMYSVDDDEYALDGSKMSVEELDISVDVAAKRRRTTREVREVLVTRNRVQDLSETMATPGASSSKRTIEMQAEAIGKGGVYSCLLRMPLY